MASTASLVAAEKFFRLATALGLVDNFRVVFAFLGAAFFLADVALAPVFFLAVFVVAIVPVQCCVIKKSYGSTD